MPTKKLSSQSGLTKFDWPLTGRLRKDVDPALIGETHFQELINLRPVADGIRGIQGMTPLNVAALPYTNIVNGFHFEKGQPDETHVFVQANSGANSKLYKSANTTAVPNQDTFSDFATLENNNHVLFSNAPNGAMLALNGASNRIWTGLEDRCGQFIVYDPSGSFFYDYTDKVNNTLQDAKNVATMYAVAGATHVYIGSPRPLQGVKFYVKTANASAAVATLEQWTGATWANLAVTDGTILVAGKSLSKTGSIAFASTVSTSKITDIRNSVAYFYHFTFTGLDATTTIYHCTLDAPMQPVTDLWDGSGRTCLGFFIDTTGAGTYTDYTTNVLPSTPANPKPYVATYHPSYADLTMGAGAYGFCGFSERMMGLIFSMPDATAINTDAVVINAVDYWNGVAWVSVGTVTDGTKTSTQTLHNGGNWTWQTLDENIEFKTKVANDQQYYYYRFNFTGGTGPSVVVNTITGIPVQKQINPYRFSLLWQNRLWMFNDQVDKKNTGLYSAYGTNCVFNGDDSGIREFGDSNELTCGETMFSRYGTGLYDNMVLLKTSSLFLIDGTTPPWTTYTISSKIGCVAPLTLKRCDMSYEVTQGVSKHVLIFRSARGVEFFDGNTLTSISGDISNFFDSSSPDYIDPTVYDVSLESGSFDENFDFYHWMFENASGKQEWVYALHYKKWFQINRGTGKALNCGFSVVDTDGNPYLYGGTSDGFLEHTENGTTFDGNPITYTFHTGDILLVKSAMYVTRLRHLKLMAKSKNVSTAKVTCTHYADTDSSPSTPLFPTISQKNTKRVYQWKHSCNIDAVLHSLKFTVTTNNEVSGFEPLMISGLMSVTREDV